MDHKSICRNGSDEFSITRGATLLELSINEERKMKIKKRYQTFWLKAEILEKEPELWKLRVNF